METKLIIKHISREEHIVSGILEMAINKVQIQIKVTITMVMGKTTTATNREDGKETGTRDMTIPCMETKPQTWHLF